MLEAVVPALVAEARRADERRLLVLAGGREAGLAAAAEAVSLGGFDPDDCVYLGPPHERVDGLPGVAPERSAGLLGATHAVAVLDLHDRLDPDAVGRAVGTVDGGGLLVLVCPPLGGWPGRRDGFDDSLAVPPATVDEVTGRFRRRFVHTLEDHPGVAIVDVDSGSVDRDGLTEPAAAPRDLAPTIPEGIDFPRAAYEACLTADQVACLHRLEALVEPATAVVIESDRGRGKSSVAGLGAAALALEAEAVVVTAPEFRSAAEAFARAGELLDELDALEASAGEPPRSLEATGGGRVEFVPPTAVGDADPDVLIVDEAAGIAVSVLADLLDVDRIAFATTVHGYEGAGRGFSVRFRDRLLASDHAVIDVHLEEPIRYAPGDPVEVWAFRALLLDARPPVGDVVEDASPASATYARLDPDWLVDDEALLREVFGLLVLAHYRTRPADLARLLDAPNVTTRALLADGHVVSVALLAREGDLPADLRAEMYEGGRVRGNMIPDVLTSQLRDEDAGTASGVRVMRIATHGAVRSRGLGSRLLGAVHAEFAGDVDWFGAGFGATGPLVSFWAQNGYASVHLSSTRNEASGEHSVVMLRPVTDPGRALLERHRSWFVRRLRDQLSDALDGVDPDVVRAALGSTGAAVEADLSAAEWRHVAAVAYGPGLIDVDPGPFRRLAVRCLVEPEAAGLEPRQERLLVRKVLQARPWGETAEALGYASHRTCMRALGDAFKPVVDRLGPAAARDERDRFEP